MKEGFSNVQIREPLDWKQVKIFAFENSEIRESVGSKWQDWLDLIAKIANIPTALIMKLNEETIEVFTSSNTEGNPFKAGQQEKLDQGLFCETVIGTQKPLMVPNATKNAVWNVNNPVLDMNLVSYLGLPVNWPDGEVFGTICILDNKENHFNQISKDAIGTFKQSIETDLELLRSKQILRESEEKYRLITENLSDVVWVYNATRQSFTYFSPSITQIKGFSVEEALQKSLVDFHPPETVTFLKQAIADAVAEFDVNSVEPKTYYYEVQAISKDGSLAWEAFKARLRSNQEGEIEILGISRSTDQRKKAEIAILRDQILLRTLINNIPNPIYIKDREGRKILANAADLEVMSISSELEVIGKTDLELYHEDDKQDGFNQDMQVMGKEGSIINQEVFFTDKKGEVCWMLITKVPLFDEQGNVSGLVGINHNITKQKKTEMELAQLAEELKKTNAMKDKLFSIIAHDLRSPLSSISMSLDLMTSNIEIDDDLKSEMMKDLKKSTTNTLNLLDNLLNWARSQTGTLNLHPEELNISNLISQSVELLASNANQKSITVVVKADYSLRAFADLESVKLIIRNLFSNAIKFTPNNGFISVMACENGNMIEVAVQDTGIGMKKEMVGNLFKINSSMTTYGTNHEKGSGIGLILVRDFVERNGGTINVESKIGKGSKFAFTLPKIAVRVELAPSCSWFRWLPLSMLLIKAVPLFLSESYKEEVGAPPAISVDDLITPFFMTPESHSFSPLINTPPV